MRPLLALLLSLALDARGDLVTVSTLADSGPGSLRAAVTAPCDDRTVRFSVGGEIVLSSSLRISCKRLLVDGLTAPAPVRIVHRIAQFAPAVDIYETETVRLRGLTIIAPVVHAGPANHDAIRVWHSRQVTLSRLTLSAEDEAIEIAGSQQVVVAESILRSEPNGKCLLIYQPETDQVLVWRNVFDHCQNRAPLVAAGRRVVVANNVSRGTIGWGAHVYAHNYGLPGEADMITQVDYEANLHEPAESWNPWLRVGGDGTPNRPSPGTVSLFVAGNLDSYHRLSNAQAEWDGVEVLGGRLSKRTSRSWAHGAKVVPASDLRGLEAGAP